MDAQSSLPVITADWRQSERERIRVTLDHDVVDVRLFFVGDPQEPLRPGRTGIALPVSHVPALAAGLKEALREARARRLVE
jgi:hypothetical protein